MYTPQFIEVAELWSAAVFGISSHSKATSAEVSFYGFCSPSKRILSHLPFLSGKSEFATLHYATNRHYVTLYLADRRYKNKILIFLEF
jgi:hypothetical protein